MKDAHIEDLAPFGFHKESYADIAKQLKHHAEELDRALSGNGKKIVKIKPVVVEKL